jgi:DNA-binding NarL/FixJ family response regulator
MVRDGLKAVLGTQTDLEVVGEAGTGTEAVSFARQLRPDVAILDLEMPELSGVGAIPQIREVSPLTRVLVFTAFDRDEQILGALRAGAAGYLLKGAPREEVFRAIRVVHAGGSLIEPLLASTLLRTVRGEPEVLTDRERDVLDLVAQGYTNQRIGRALFISERTVKFHVSSILTKLGAANRTEAAAVARERGLLRPI